MTATVLLVFSCRNPAQTVDPAPPPLELQDFISLDGGDAGGSGGSIEIISDEASVYIVDVDSPVFSWESVASTIPVPDAELSVGPGETVELSPGTYTYTGADIAGNLRLVSTGGPGDFVFDISGDCCISGCVTVDNAGGTVRFEEKSGKTGDFYMADTSEIISSNGSVFNLGISSFVDVTIDGTIDISGDSNNHNAGSLEVQTGRFLFCYGRLLAGGYSDGSGGDIFLFSSDNLVIRTSEIRACGGKASGNGDAGNAGEVRICSASDIQLSRDMILDGGRSESGTGGAGGLFYGWFSSPDNPIAESFLLDGSISADGGDVDSGTAGDAGGIILRFMDNHSSLTIGSESVLSACSGSAEGSGGFGGGPSATGIYIGSGPIPANGDSYDPDLIDSQSVQVNGTVTTGLGRADEGSASFIDFNVALITLGENAVVKALSGGKHSVAGGSYGNIQTRLSTGVMVDPGAVVEADFIEGIIRTSVR